MSEGFRVLFLIWALLSNFLKFNLLQGQLRLGMDYAGYGFDCLIVVADSFVLVLVDKLALILDRLHVFEFMRTFWALLLLFIVGLLLNGLGNLVFD